MYKKFVLIFHTFKPDKLNYAIIRYKVFGRLEHIMQITDKDLEEHRQKFQKCRVALHALGNESRQEICMVLMLNSNGLRVADLAQSVNLSRSVVSHHMKILIEAGIVKSRKEGTYIYYYLDMESKVLDYLIAYFQSVKNILRYLPDRSGGELL